MKNELKITKKTLRGEDKYKTFSLRINEKTFSMIDEIADKTNRSRNEIIRILIEYGLENI